MQSGFSGDKYDRCCYLFNYFVKFIMEGKWVVWMGDFRSLRKTLSSKKTSFLWFNVGVMDAFLRGIGQVVFANNPISGGLILIALALASPGVLLSGSITGLLGVFISLLIQDPAEKFDNGLTIYNPFLVGAITYSLFPISYGPWDTFAVFLTLFTTISSVYLTRSLSNWAFPCVTAPFNFVEILLFLILTMYCSSTNIHGASNTDDQMSTQMSVSGFLNNTQILSENITQFNWGMIFKGIVTSPAQVFAVNSVEMGSIIYLAILIYSPITTVFCLTGSIVGCIGALGLKIPCESIYSGLWGYNSSLSGAAHGGLFFVFNKHTIPLVFIASTFTVLLQYVLEPVFTRIAIPIFTVPFLLTFWLFIGLRDSSTVFPRPVGNLTFPEEQCFNVRFPQQVDAESN